LASPLNKSILVVRLGRKSHYILAAFAKPRSLAVIVNEHQSNFKHNNSVSFLLFLQANQ
jgi:hypothetical protein